MYKYRGYIIEKERDDEGTHWRVFAPNGDDMGSWDSEDIARARVDVCCTLDRYNEMFDEVGLTPSWRGEEEEENLEGKFLYQDGFWLYFTTTNPYGV